MLKRKKKEQKKKTINAVNATKGRQYPRLYTTTKNNLDVVLHSVLLLPLDKPPSQRVHHLHAAKLLELLPRASVPGFSEY
jgi:hypothetical protein